MRAVQIHGEKDIRMADVPMPVPNDDELLLKVAGVCVCGSDLHYYLEGGVNTKRIIDPQIPGHEISAWVWDDRAEEFGFKRGQLVAVEPTEVCGNCDHCHNGRPNLCQSQKFYGGPPHQGALAEYFKAT
ncbi:MAG: alcohol dehydrogenase catalytic domain-containing protein, partial [Rhodospirillales bacterium]|nr:alcohol dehydrogenase catalytic domain-containing protein [Rhodospirillales bacterium]